MSSVRHSTRISKRKFYFWQRDDKESKQQLIDWKQGKLLKEIETENNYNNLSSQIEKSQVLAKHIKPTRIKFKTIFKTIFHWFLKKLKRIFI